MDTQVLWGFIGPQHARFSDFVYRPGTVLRYLRDLISLRWKRYLVLLQGDIGNPKIESSHLCSNATVFLRLGGDV